jgi:undecaprenyl pyrophosphate phosphatase UppP
VENKKGLSVVLMIPAIIIGIALYEQFDFENLKFEKPVLAIVYIVGNALSVIFQVKAFKKQSRK